MVQRCLDLFSVNINQHVEFRVDVILAHGLIHGLPIELGLLDLLHFAPTVLPLLLQLGRVLDLLNAVHKVVERGLVPQDVPVNKRVSATRIYARGVQVYDLSE